MEHAGLWCFLNSMVMGWMDRLPKETLEDNPGGLNRGILYRKMREAHDVFLWRAVAMDIVHRTRREEARVVKVTFDRAAQCGFVLRHPCKDFDLRPSPEVPVGPLSSQASALASQAVAASRPTVG